MAEKAVPYEVNGRKFEGMIVYDALYAWAGGARDEVHDWRPQ